MVRKKEKQMKLENLRPGMIIEKMNKVAPKGTIVKDALY